MWRLVRPLVFRVDPERAHDAAVRVAELLSRAPALRPGPPSDPRLAVSVAGMRLASPLGLAAGFDKSARAVPLLGSLGFGHVEIGSVSREEAAGNPKPRLWRLPAERAIVVHYGVPNDGATAVAARLGAARRPVPVGVNLVSTSEDVLDDYVASFRRLQGLADYVCLNLSCPNTVDGRGYFADRSRLRELLDRLGDAGVFRPLFIKVAPFGAASELDSFLAAANAPFVSGFSVNLPPGGRPGMPGAVSGPPSAARAERTVAELHRASARPVIGSGGVSSAEDAYRMIRAGASLVQVYTVLVYEGPRVVSGITSDLASLVARDGFASVGDAVGA